MDFETELFIAFESENSKGDLKLANIKMHLKEMIEWIYLAQECVQQRTVM
jgi:hypothetical protein